MSEFPFAEEADLVEDEAGTDKRKLLVAGGLAAALVLGAGAYFLTSGGDAEDEAFVVKKRAPRVAAPAAPAVKAPTKVPVVFAAPVGRDPFRALYTVPVAAPAAPAPVAPVTPVTTTPTQAPTTGGGTVVITPTKAPTSTTAPQQQSQSTIRFKSYDAVTKVGTYVLDGKTTLTGKVGSVLAKKVLIVAMRPDREPGTYFATLKVGDGAQFDAHYGQTVVIP